MKPHLDGTRRHANVAFAVDDAFGRLDAFAGAFESDERGPQFLIKRHRAATLLARRKPAVHEPGDDGR